MKSAKELFAGRGVAASSVNDIAENAGYSKGAFYAYFSNKEEICLELLKSHFDLQLARIDAAISASDDIAESTLSAAFDFVQQVAEDRDWALMHLEFALYAARNDTFRERLVSEHQTIRERSATVIQSRMSEAGFELQLDPANFVWILTDLVHGHAISQLLDPAADPQQLSAALFMLASGATKPVDLAP